MERECHATHLFHEIVARRQRRALLLHGATPPEQATGPGTGPGENRRREL